MSKKCVIVYDNPSLWKADVLYSENPKLDAAKRALCPFYLRDRETEPDLEPFTEDEIAAIERTEPTSGAVLVREDNVGGVFCYRKVVSGGNLDPDFCKLHFDLNETQAKINVHDFLANLGASNIDIEIARTTNERMAEGLKTKTDLGGKAPEGGGRMNVATDFQSGATDKEVIKGRITSEANDPDFDEAKRMLETNAWFAHCFSGLYDRVKSGRTHGRQSETIEHHAERDFYKNAAVAVGMAVQYGLVKADLKTKVASDSKCHKDETVTLTWSCVFP